MRDREYAGIKCECKDNRFSKHGLNFIEKMLLDILEPKIYKEVRGYLLNKNVELIKDYRLIQGGM